MPNTDLYLARTVDADRERGLDRRHAIARAHRDAGEAPASGRVRALVDAARRLVPSVLRPAPVGGGMKAPSASAVVTAGAGTAAVDRLLTDLLCRTADGRQGRLEVVLADGSWTLACRLT
jgi:hypothetical protein